MIKSFSILLPVFLILAPTCAHGGGFDDYPPEYRGMVLSAGWRSYNSSLAGQDAPAGSIVTLGVGYNLPFHFIATLRAHAGRETIPGGEGRTVYGRLSLGGAGLDISYELPVSFPVTPYITAGFDAYTILQGGGGYMANGPRVAVGGRYHFARHFSLELGVTVNSIRFYGPYGDIVWTGPFPGFRATCFGAGVTLNFYPDFLP